MRGGSAGVTCGTTPSWCRRSPTGRLDPGDVLRHHADRRPDAVCLDCPRRTSRFTYAEALAEAERSRAWLRRGGAVQGDRVLIMAANSSQFVRTWFGAARRRPGRGADQHRLRGRVPAPPAGRRARPRWAVIDDVLRRALVRHRRARPRSSRSSGSSTPAGIRDKALALLRDERLGAPSLGGAGAAPTGRSCPSAAAAGPRRDLLHLRHHRPVQGRGDAALAAVLLRPEVRQPAPG